MISFLLGVALLLGGYFGYSKVVEKVFRIDDRQTPALVHGDGVDFVPMPVWKAFLIQLLNIAGLGPIFGAITGALWGPSVYLWIVFGTIFGGAVHDYLGGMLSQRNNGASIAEIVGKYMGSGMKQFMRIFTVILLTMVGAVFIIGPAGLIALLTPDTIEIPFGSKVLTVPFGEKFWIVAILIYYTLATFLPIDKIIGKFYPVFGIALIVMAVGIAGGTLVNHFNGTRPMLELWNHATNMDPRKLPMWPLMFISVSCGAISGFHATQSPLMARCTKNEKESRHVFYGAMVMEGFIALVWASAAITFFYKPEGGSIFLEPFVGNSTTVYTIAVTLLGPFGSFLAMVGVVACPITSGDTSFRSVRLTLADWFKLDQKDMGKRLLVTIPVLAAGYGISLFGYDAVWRYVSWSNQVLAMIVLWCISIYLARYSSNSNNSWMTAFPATFMVAVTVSYILQAPEGFRLDPGLSSAVGLIAAMGSLIFFIIRVYMLAKSPLIDIPLEVVKG